MRYLLDTGVLSDFARGEPRTLARVKETGADGYRRVDREMEDARATATSRAALQKRGRPMGAYDALIAGCAIARGLVLVTTNAREFARAGGLKVENWRKA